MVSGGPGIDLELLKTVSPQEPEYNDIITYTLDLTNRGPSIAHNIEVLDSLPTGLDFVSASATIGGYDVGTGIWSLAQLNTSQSASLNIQARVRAPGLIENSAQVWTADEPDIDSTPANGDPAEDDQDSAAINIDTLVDLLLTKTTLDPDRVPLGHEGRFLNELINLGPSPATGVEVLEQLPQGLDFVAALPSQGRYDASSGIWTVGELLPNAMATMELVLVVTAIPEDFRILNLATASSIEPDADPDNNADDAVLSTYPPVPTLQTWGMILFIVGLMLCALIMRRIRENRALDLENY